MQTTPAPHQRIYGLDILRAFAIIFVMVEHGRFLLPVELFPNHTWFFLKCYLDGVSVFFVLSGFLIGRIILKAFGEQYAGIKTLTNFWVRRWMRTLPNYFFVLSLLLFLGLGFQSQYDSNSSWKYFLFIQNFSSPHPIFFGEAWSLSIEEWFYLLLPVLLFTGRKLFGWPVKKAVMAGALLFILIPLAIRYYRFYSMEVNDLYVWDNYFRRQVVTRMDSLMTGVLGACCSVYYPRMFNYKKGLFFIAGILLLIFNKALELSHLAEWGMYQTVWLFSVNAVATLFLLPFLWAVKTGTGAWYRILTRLSILSYSMYLLNLALVQGWILPRLVPDNFLPVRTGHLVKYGLFWVLTISLSYLLYRYFEKPVMNLRNRFSS